MSSLSEKIAHIEAMRPGCKLGIVGEGDEAVIQISEFGNPFIVRKEWAKLEGEWPECWFDYEIARKQPLNRPYAIDPIKLAAGLGLTPEERDVCLVAGEHPYHCRCDTCKEWWKAVGPDPATGRCGPCTME